MYTKVNRLISSKSDLSNYIEGYDVFNSSLLEKLQDPGLTKEAYQITVYKYRPDLIAEDFYGSDSYLSLVLVQCGVGLEAYTPGTILELIPKEKLDSIIANI